MADTVKLSVRSKSGKGFYRGGRYWGPEAEEVEVPAAMAETLRRERLLDVRDAGGTPMGADPQAERHGAPALVDPQTTPLGGSGSGTTVKGGTPGPAPVTADDPEAKKPIETKPADATKATEPTASTAPDASAPAKPADGKRR